MRLRSACLILLLPLVAPLVARAGPPRSSGQPYAVVGVVVSAGRGLVTLRVERGGMVTFRLLEGTLPAGGPRAGGPAPGTRVQVWVLPVPEGFPVVLRILPVGGPAPARPVLEAGALRGVVLAQSARILSVLGERNVLHTVLIAGTTVIQGGAILPRAVVLVDGTRNSDGSVSARAIRILFDPRGATRLTGRVAVLWPGVGFMLQDGTVVVVSEDTWIVRGTTLRSFGAFVPAAVVTVSGVGAPPFVHARVIEISL